MRKSVLASGDQFYQSVLWLILIIAVGGAFDAAWGAGHRHAVACAALAVLTLVAVGLVIRRERRP